MASLSRISHDNLETCSLLWLDSTINNSEQNLHTQQRLQTIINHFVTFEDSTSCEDYIRSIPNHDRIIIIVSGLSGRQLVPRIHQIEQVDSIYVYCMDRKTNEKWTKNFTKVNFTELNFIFSSRNNVLRFKLLLSNHQI